jgi:hypothetical protein
MLFVVVVVAVAVETEIADIDFESFPEETPATDMNIHKAPGHASYLRYSAGCWLLRRRIGTMKAARLWRLLLLLLASRIVMNNGAWRSVSMRRHMMQRWMQQIVHKIGIQLVNAEYYTVTIHMLLAIARVNNTAELMMIVA